MQTNNYIQSKFKFEARIDKSIGLIAFSIYFPNSNKTLTTKWLVYTEITSNFIKVKNLFHKPASNYCMRISATGNHLFSIEPCLIDYDYNDEIVTYIHLINSKHINLFKGLITIIYDVIQLPVLNYFVKTFEKPIDIPCTIQCFCLKTQGAAALDIVFTNEINIGAYQFVYLWIDRLSEILGYINDKSCEILLRSSFSKKGCRILECNTRYILICLGNNSIKEEKQLFQLFMPKTTLLKLVNLKKIINIDIEEHELPRINHHQ